MFGDELAYGGPLGGSADTAAVVSEASEDPGHDENAGVEEPFDQTASGHIHTETTTEQAAGISGNVSLGELIQRYGHNHGQADIGSITQRNPVALMKRAVGYMWQAEHHLMQAESEQALPFEYKALKYLKLAQQADRIYTCRLGFEPPPVSEQRRLEGELNEVLSYASQEQAVLGLADDQFLLHSSFKLLSTQQGAQLGSEQQQLLQRLRERLTAWSRQHPALIQQAATVERLLVAGELSLSKCADCLDSLLTQVWDLLDPSAAPARAGGRNYFNDDVMIRDWQRVTASWGAHPIIRLQP